jgi:hypothetical protein
MVRRMRPGQPWGDVVRVLNRTAGMFRHDLLGGVAILGIVHDSLCRDARATDDVSPGITSDLLSTSGHRLQSTIAHPTMLRLN